MSDGMDVATGAAGGDAIIGGAVFIANVDAGIARKVRDASGSAIRLTNLNALKETLDFKIFIKLVDDTGVCTFGSSNLKILIDTLQDSNIMYNCEKNVRSMCVKVNSAEDRTELIDLIKSKLNAELHFCISANGSG